MRACINILIKVHAGLMEAARRSKCEQNAEISADAVGEVEHGIVSH